MTSGLATREPPRRRRSEPAKAVKVPTVRCAIYTRKSSDEGLQQEFNSLDAQREGYHINWLQAEQLWLVEVDADHWKTWVHQRVISPLDKPGAMTWYQASAQQHLALIKHLTAETKTEEFIAGKGVVTRWERIRRQNHWLDALYNACAAGFHSGARLVDTAPPPPPRRGRIVGHLTVPDGRPWFDGESLAKVWRGLME